MSALTLGMIGLRRAGACRRWLAAGVTVHGWDADPRQAAAAAAVGVHVWPSAVGVVQRLPASRVVWLDIAPGRATEVAVQDVWPELARGEVIVDGGDGDWRDARRREAALASAGVRFADAADLDSEILVGGSGEAVTALHALLVARGAWRHCGGAGAAHFVRMVHAGVAVAAQAARAEAQALLAAHPELVRAQTTLPVASLAAPGLRTLAQGVVHAAHATGVAAPMLSLALALPSASSGAGAGEGDGGS